MRDSNTKIGLGYPGKTPNSILTTLNHEGVVGQFIRQEGVCGPDAELLRLLSLMPVVKPGNAVWGTLAHRLASFLPVGSAPRREAAAGWGTSGRNDFAPIWGMTVNVEGQVRHEEY